MVSKERRKTRAVEQIKGGKEMNRWEEKRGGRRTEERRWIEDKRGEQGRWINEMIWEKREEEQMKEDKNMNENMRGEKRRWTDNRSERCDLLDGSDIRSKGGAQRERSLCDTHGIPSTFSSSCARVACDPHGNVNRHVNSTFNTSFSRSTVKISSANQPIRLNRST